MLHHIRSDSDERLSADQAALLETDFYRQLVDYGVQVFLTETGELVPGISTTLTDDLGGDIDLVATFANREGWAPISSQEPVTAKLLWSDGEHSISGFSVTECSKTPSDYVLWMLVRLAVREMTPEAPQELIVADAELSNRLLADDMADVDPDDFCDQLYRAHKVQ